MAVDPQLTHHHHMPSPMWSSGRITGRNLLAARVAWTAVVMGLFVLATIGVVRGLENPDLVTPPLLAELVTSSPDFRLMMLINLVLPLAVVGVFAMLAFWAGSDEPQVLLLTMSLLFLYTFSSRSLLPFGDDPMLRHSLSVVFAVAIVLLALVLGLFPNGRFVPRPARWLPLAALAVVVAVPEGGWLLVELLDGRAGITGRGLALLVAVALVLALGLLAQVHRFRHVSDSAERQRTKWGAVPLFLPVLVATLGLVAAAGVPEQSVGWMLFVFLPLGTLLPVMVAVAVVFYRLYVVHRVIRRTIAYGLLIWLLAAIYATSVIGLGAAATALSGQEDSNLVVAGAVLVVVMLFRPISSRVHRAVERRFNRTGYTARQVIEDASGWLTDQVKLEEVSAGLAKVAAAAFQPEHVSVWIPVERPRSHRRRPDHADPADDAHQQTNERLPGGILPPAGWSRR